VSAPTGAVFLSYASEDSEAAARIAEALRVAGFEVWFDKSELRGGDAQWREFHLVHDCPVARIGGETGIESAHDLRVHHIR
jgi:hypothetical protein